MKRLVWIDDEMHVVVPRDPDLKMVIAGENYVGRHAFAKMIAAAPTLPDAQPVTNRDDVERAIAFHHSELLLIRHFPT